MTTFLDTLLRDSAEGEHFCPLEAPTFLSAPEPSPVQLLERPRVARPITELVVDAFVTPPFARVDFLTALIFRVRPARDPDRFTLGLGLAVSTGNAGDPFPILF